MAWIGELDLGTPAPVLAPRSSESAAPDAKERAARQANRVAMSSLVEDVPVEVRVYLLDVESLADDWLESGQRKRRWFEPARAAELVAETGLKRLLAGMVPADGSPA